MIARLAIAVMCSAAIALSACGGSDETDATVPSPVLRNSPIPTAAVEPTATPVCDPPATAELPANFPADVPVPPGYKVDGVETSPHLKVEGRVIPPESRGPAYGTVFQAILDNMITQGWRAQRSAEGDGAHITFQDAQGRAGSFTVLPIVGCAREVQLTYELEWIMP